MSSMTLTNSTLANEPICQQCGRPRSQCGRTRLPVANCVTQPAANILSPADLAWLRDPANIRLQQQLAADAARQQYMSLNYCQQTPDDMQDVRDMSPGSTDWAALQLERGAIYRDAIRTTTVQSVDVRAIIINENGEREEDFVVGTNWAALARQRRELNY